MRSDRHSLIWLLVLALGLLTDIGWAQNEDDDIAAGSPEWDDPDAPVDPRFEEARENHVAGRFNRAFALYDEILADRGPDAATLTTYGNMKWKIGRMTEAEALLQAAIRSMPKHIKSRQFLGQLYVHQGRRADARKTFEDLLALDWVRGDVADSAKLNLARLDLWDGKWLEARKGFNHLRREGGKADRKSGDRGLRLISTLLELDQWPRFDSKHLKIHFSPKLKQFSGRDAKGAYAEELDKWIELVVSKLGIAMPEPWDLYVFESDAECGAITGRMEAHGWDYSWWLSHTAVNSKYGPKHTLAAQFAARWSGSRPISRPLVEGLCAYIAGELKEPHAELAAMAKNYEIHPMATVCQWQRHVDHYAYGTSMVRYLIDTYGFEKFSEVWKHFNVTMNAPQFKKRSNTTNIDWEAALDDLFTTHLGASYEVVNSGWLALIDPDR
ncbi:MAG: hypothetical protein KDB53_05515 [Planctomycetes bacterium]|nr:hypothetical protein [Planctomycetota bacterium]